MAPIPWPGVPTSWVSPMAGTAEPDPPKSDPQIASGGAMAGPPKTDAASSDSSCVLVEPVEGKEVVRSQSVLGMLDAMDVDAEGRVRELMACIEGNKSLIPLNVNEKPEVEANRAEVELKKLMEQFKETGPGGLITEQMTPEQKKAKTLVDELDAMIKAGDVPSRSKHAQKWFKEYKEDPEFLACDTNPKKAKFRMKIAKLKKAEAETILYHEESIDQVDETMGEYLSLYRIWQEEGMDLAGWEALLSEVSPMHQH